MSAPAPALAAFQADFRAWLVESDRAAAARLGSPAGLAIYQNNYRTALITSLEATYPRLQLWLGTAAFEAAAVHFSDDNPPHSWTLDAFGMTFAEKLAQLYPDDLEVPELARIEWAMGQAFVAQDTVPVVAADLGGVDWDRAGLRFAPSLEMLPLNTNADALWLALVSDEPPPAVIVDTAPATLLVWRHGLESVMRRADPVEIHLLQMALGGVSFAELCADLAAQLGDDAAVATAGQWLGRWIAEELIAAIG